MDMQAITYEFGGKSFTGYLADGSRGKPTAGVLVAHEGGGMTGHPRQRAQMLAELGYVAFAMDTFGYPIESREQAMATITGLMGDLPTLQGRARTALEVLRAQPNVDAARTAAIGFCFGGTTVLELARSGADVPCVIGFHSGLGTSTPAAKGAIKGKVMVCLGSEDPIISAADREAFVGEMSAAGADWQMMLLGGVGHSFTNREVDAMGLPGFRYDETADHRTWRAMRGLFDETLGPVG
ncbi:dienelactone hydrolase family protein [Phenylobacterium sp.]|uniref:dienelactone hydrolase family protein n=1 Tax=Phenylobacterium sp. TaxID=1871053 RepID=UPI0027368751|nr:dienelactone hydrolase family protein [Phenylobacterium sp.]MDP3852587.1 dienelactone hydrolase family protein [Phenylobacterium sp.]